MMAKEGSEGMALLKKDLPSGRSLEQIRNHYEVERAIADSLKKADREERKAIYATMYDLLLEKVPDHPRLTMRESKELTARANHSKMNLVKRFLNKSAVFVEFAPGDCHFATKVSKRVRHVYGVDISDQRGKKHEARGNFELIVYDGHHIDLPDETADVVFSDQLIEHLHPEEVVDHFRLAARLLRKGGVYVFRTPHRFSGPHDISGYFSDESEGFHLKEWTYTELGEVLRMSDYNSWRGLFQVKGLCLEMPFIIFTMIEGMLKFLPRHWQRSLTPHVLRGIAIAAYV
ncbi:Phenylalanyl-tRNA synthetase subunit alpha [Candidatus Sulfobium mesophilum]|uniref:Phenylalanyl-tRNA synthetase subunit alpha n=1 Tax=Candidatus Sulfobium mesophilum TaxID=2016548 RepID=A0A2U3QDM8_9BACT|nr:Phenylalanyl-tRNA synthetase subunit alpha [Candidatus Sulfobium mesophilum]